MTLVAKANNAIISERFSLVIVLCVELCYNQSTRNPQGLSPPWFRLVLEEVSNEFD